MGFPDGASGKDLPVNAGDVRATGSIPGSGRSPGGGRGSPLQYSCLENPTDRGACWATVRGVTKESDMSKQNNAFLQIAPNSPGNSKVSEQIKT